MRAARAFRIAPDYEGLETICEVGKPHFRGLKFRIAPDYEGLETTRRRACQRTLSFRIAPDYEGLDTHEQIAKRVQVVPNSARLRGPRNVLCDLPLDREREVPNSARLRGPRNDLHLGSVDKLGQFRIAPDYEGLESQ